MAKYLNFIFFILYCAQASTSDLERSFTYPHQKEYGYAAVVKHGDTLYLSGISAPGKDMEEQIRHVYIILKKTLEEHGSAMENVLNERVSTTDIQKLNDLNMLRKSFYPEGAYPASSWYQVNRLFMPDALIEIEIVAALHSK